MHDVYVQVCMYVYRQKGAKFNPKVLFHSLSFEEMVEEGMYQGTYMY